MTTTIFRNIRALIQLTSVLSILINIPLPVILFFNYRLSKIELENLQMNFLSLSFCYKVIIIFNITLGMFASCGTNSKIKMYMRLYLFCAFMYMIVLITYILYVKNYYQDRLITTFVEKSTVSLQQRVLMSNILYCSPSENCEENLKRLCSKSVNVFLLFSGVSFVLHLISFVLIKIAVNIKIEKEPVKLPNFVNVTKAGMDTQSLRSKRVMEIDSPVNYTQSLVL
ncbi:uncharacterized protein VNE69_12013 [Vairimorpha necatrix]|uniref:Membrane protein n=1 Tax=Vairimorpha necatrix TaxID=6039 RepID=A0AAX4JGA3_9MICR